MKTHFLDILRMYHAAAPPRTRLRRNSARAAVMVFIGSVLYILMADAVITPLPWTQVVNDALADAGLLLICASMALSGLCYFWDFADRYIIYRKHLGLWGCALIVAHGGWTLALPQYSIALLLQPQNIRAFIFAVIASIILLMMAAISNRYAVTELGGRWWRRLLRLGYVAIFFGAWHALIKKAPLWAMWMEAPLSAPPLSLVVVLVSGMTIVLRIALWIHQTFYRHD